MGIAELLGLTKPNHPRPASAGMGGDALDAQPSRWDTLFAGLSDVGSNLKGEQGTKLAGLQATQDAAAKRQQLYALAKVQFPDDPKMQLAFASNPTPFLAAMAENTKDYTLSEGQVRGHNGQTVQYNGKTGIDGGRGYAIGQDGGAHWDAAARPMDYAEQTAQAAQQATAANYGVEHQDRMASNLTTQRGQNMTAASSAASTGVAAGHLALDRQKAAREAAPATGNPSLDAMAAELRRRGHQVP